MIDRIVQWTVKYRHSTFIRVVARTLVLLFPLALIGSIAKVLSLTLLNADGFLYNLLVIDRWCNQAVIQIAQNCLSGITAVTMGMIGLLSSYGAAKYTAMHYHRDFQAAGLAGIITMGLMAYRFNRGGMAVSFDWRLLGYRFLLINLLVGFIVGQFFHWLGTPMVKANNADHVIAVRQRSYSTIKPLMVSLLMGIVIDIALNIASAYSFFNGVSSSFQSQFHGSVAVLMKLLFSLISTFLGWVGLHGVFGMNWQNETSQMAANLSYVLAHGGHWHVPYPYLSSSLYNVYCRFGGDGIILALMIALLVVDHSKGTKRLAAWSIPPLFFNVDQVAMFGIPVILNPLYLLPMLLIPLINLFLAMTAIYLQLVPPIAFPILTGTPGPLMAFMGTAGYPTALIFSLLLLLADVVMYLPFVRLAVAVEKRIQLIDKREAER